MHDIMAQSHLLCEELIWWSQTAVSFRRADFPGGVHTTKKLTKCLRAERKPRTGTCWRIKLEGQPIHALSLRPHYLAVYSTN